MPTKTAAPTIEQVNTQLTQLDADVLALKTRAGDIEHQIASTWGKTNTSALESELTSIDAKLRASKVRHAQLTEELQAATQADDLLKFRQMCEDAKAAKETYHAALNAVYDAKAAYQAALTHHAAIAPNAGHSYGMVKSFLNRRHDPEAFKAILDEFGDLVVHVDIFVRKIAK